MIEGNFEKIELLKMTDTVSESVEWLSTNKVDLLFLDIQLADGLSFEIFEQLKTSTPIIFTTAFNEYAIEAFRVNSIDYLLKPIDPEALKQALDKYYRLYQQELSPTLDHAVLQEGKKYLIDYTLEQLETLVDPEQFFRINQKFLVALEGVQDMVAYSNSRLRLILHHNDSMEAIVSRERVQEFKKWLDA